jgi:hypothetical protein
MLLTAGPRLDELKTEDRTSVLVSEGGLQPRPIPSKRLGCGAILASRVSPPLPLPRHRCPCRCVFGAVQGPRDRRASPTSSWSSDARSTGPSSTMTTAACSAPIPHPDGQRVRRALDRINPTSAPRPHHLRHQPWPFGSDGSSAAHSPSWSTSVFACALEIAAGQVPLITDGGDEVLVEVVTLVAPDVVAFSHGRRTRVRQ